MSLPLLGLIAALLSPLAGVAAVYLWPKRRPPGYDPVRARSLAAQRQVERTLAEDFDRALNTHPPKDHQ